MLREQWTKLARQYVVALVKNRDVQCASVNDLFDAICEGLLEAPPKPEKGKSGQLLCNVFLGVSYFQRTDRMVAGTNPASKGRKVWIWEYLPALDDQAAQYTRSKGFFQSAKAW